MSNKQTGVFVLAMLGIVLFYCVVELFDGIKAKPVPENRTPYEYMM
jgi:hypothetical protein